MGAKLEPKLKRAGDQFYLFLPMGRQGCLSSAKGNKKVRSVTPTGQFWILFEPSWDDFGVLFDYLGINLGSFLDHLGMTLG